MISDLFIFFFDLLSWALIAISILVLIACLILLFEVACSFLPADPRREMSPPGAPPSFAVLVPAHNEALVIGETLKNLLPEASSYGRIIVVADNCTDDTGLIAEKAGAGVIYRNEPELRGKGYALDFGIRYLQSNPPDTVIIIDADCTVKAGALAALASEAASRKRPVQARYDLLVPPSAENDYLMIASLAWSLKNFVRPLGGYKIGLPCHLMGTGMAFPWPLISQAGLKSGEIVEDIALTLDCAARGAAPVFQPSIRVCSMFPVSASGQETQRARWETGHLRLIASRIPKMLLRAVKSGNLGLFTVAADLAIPPLSLLFVVTGALLTLSIFLLVAAGLLTPFIVMTLAALAFIASIIFAARHTNEGGSIFKIIHVIPKYALSKMSIYLSAFAGKPLEWIRSKRD